MCSKDKRVGIEEIINYIPDFFLTILLTNGASQELLAISVKFEGKPCYFSSFEML